MAEVQEITREEFAVLNPKQPVVIMQRVIERPGYKYSFNYNRFITSDSWKTRKDALGFAASNGIVAKKKAVRIREDGTSYFETTYVKTLQLKKALTEIFEAEGDVSEYLKLVSE